MVCSAVELVVDLCKALKWQGHVLFEGWSSGCEEDENLEPLKTDGSEFVSGVEATLNFKETIKKHIKTRVLQYF